MHSYSLHEIFNLVSSLLGCSRKKKKKKVKWHFSLIFLGSTLLSLINNPILLSHNGKKTRRMSSSNRINVRIHSRIKESWLLQQSIEKLMFPCYVFSVYFVFFLSILLNGRVIDSLTFLLIFRFLILMSWKTLNSQSISPL